METPSGRKIIGANRRARHEYHILDKYEAGLVLQGTEVKALREGRVSLVEGFARFMGDELYLVNVHINPYSHTGGSGHAALRERKLLLGRRELRKLRKAAQIKGQTLIPLSMYFRGGWAKVELAVCRGKQQHDKRQALAEREVKRQLARTMKEHKTA